MDLQVGGQSVAIERHASHAAVELSVRAVRAVRVVRVRQQLLGGAFQVGQPQIGQVVLGPFDLLRTDENATPSSTQSSTGR